MALPKRKLTLEEFLELPEEEPALEYEDGEITQKVSPKGKHSTLQYEFGLFLGSVLRPGKQARILPELRSSYRGRSYVPDLSVYRYDRVPVGADGRIGDDFREPPDVAIEIVSPGQRVNALVRRCLWYVNNGVQAALMLDPADESIVVFRPNQIPQGLQDDDVVDLSDLFTGLRFTVREVFESLKV